MNESPWQPPADGQPSAEPPTADQPFLPTPEPAVAAPPQADEPTSTSPWSPDGAGAWTHPPEPAVPTTGSTTPPPPDSWAQPVAPTVPPVPGVTPGATIDGTIPDGTMPHGKMADGTIPAQPVVGPRSSPEPARRRSKLVVGGAVAAVGALGLAGLFAVQRFADGAAGGGAATADELGADLLAAIEAEDVLGVIDTMLPGEREALGEPFVEMVGELQRLEILSADTDLSRLLGLDVEFENELVELEGTNVPDIVNVRLTADAAVTLDGATLPIGDFLESQIPDDMLTELRGTRLTETDQLDLALTAVQDDDRWYFSAFHTLAELARQESGGEPIPAEGVAPDGADSPEAAIDRVLDRVAQLDVRGLIAMLDPAEAAALQRYSPLFLDEAEAAVAEVPLDWRIDLREFRVEGDGDQRTVFVDALGISGTARDSEFFVRFSDGCVSAEFEGETFEQCEDESTAEFEEMLGEAPAVEAFVATVTDAFADMEPVGFELRQRDGAWYVSPLATGSEAMLAAVRALERSELDAMVTDGTAAAEEFVDLFLGGLPGIIEDQYGDGGFTIDDGFDSGGSLTVEPDQLDDPLGDETDDFEAASSAGDQCYEQRIAADAAACFRDFVDAGVIDEFSVPASLLHPECGMAELQWEGGMFDLSDEEFTAVLAVAAPCFDALVTSGDLDGWMVPYEVMYADCFEGRNWYSVFDDQAYNDRVQECVEATPPPGG